MGVNFKKPPPAPIFSPTIEEFSDPISYIKSIYPIAYNYGICKIRPPEGWRPPFCIDPLVFTFNPRLQHLSEVSAYNRIRNNFITSLVNFWEAQDVTVFAPYIKRRKLDLFSLWKAVQASGGYYNVCSRKLWCSVSKSLGFEDIPQFASAISTKYKKILLPYELFIKSQNKSQDTASVDSKRTSRTRSPQKRKPSTKILTCTICGQGNNDAYLLLCDGCETIGACHTYCLEPPLSDVPKGSWFCPQCIMKRFSRLQVNVPFGFRRSKKPRTLAKFNVFADDFMSNHFGKPAHMVSIDETENEFWKILSDEDADIIVEYGADLSARDHGSGFPSKRAKIRSQDRFYVESPWNLNNVALSEKSALRFIPKDISGMIIPWVYVGMVFSCFCWHTEDHWSYSINYLHTGSPKIWYGVPTKDADAFEAAMRAEIPELFEHSPDLLHHMTTMVAPANLQQHGVPVYRLDQMAGEFVITFPRAYHAGFNQGFNFAEAVNFCPADWFELGQHSIEHYALNHRSPVFSHAELLCRMAASADPLSVDFLLVVSRQLEALLTTERSLRRHLARLGVRRTERMVFEETDDEKRECDLCRTTLYLSALTCKCSPTMLCLVHHQIRTCCAREEQVMRYRYGLDELSESIAKLKAQLDEYRSWERRVTLCLTAAAPTSTSTSETGHGTGRTAGAPVEASHPRNDVSLADQPESSAGSVSMADTNHEPPPPQLEMMNDEKPELKDNGPDDLNDTAPDVVSESAECKPENDDCKPTLIDLQELVAVGESRNYPTDIVQKLKKLIQTIEECSIVAQSLMANYHSACEPPALPQSVADPDRIRTKSKPNDVDLSGSDDDDNDEEEEEADEKDDGESSDTIAEDEENTEPETDSTSTTSMECDRENRRTADRNSKDKSTLLSPLRAASPESPCKAEPRAMSQSTPMKRVMPRSARAPGAPRLKPEPSHSPATRTSLASSRPKRHRGPVTSKLSLDEFHGLMRVARQVRAYLPDWNELEQVASGLHAWTVQTHDLLTLLNSSPDCLDGPAATTQLPSVAQLDKLLRFADSISVDLEESVPLRRARDCLSWIDSVEKILATANRTELVKSGPNYEKPSLDELCLLQIKGSALSSVVAYLSVLVAENAAPLDQEKAQLPKTVLDRALYHASERLLRVIYTAKQTEAKLLAITKAKPYSLALDDVLAEVQHLDTLPVALPIVQQIRKMCEDSELIARQVEAVGQLLVSTPFGQPVRALLADTFPDDLYDQLRFGTLDCTSTEWKACVDALMQQTQHSPLQMPNVDRARQLLDFVDQCRERLVQLFIWPHSKLSLLEVLLPRSLASLESLLGLDAGSDVTAHEAHESGRPSGARRHARSSTIPASVFASLCKENAREFAKSLVTCEDAGLLYDKLYRRYIDAEQGLMQRLRGSNMAKSRAKQQNSVIYCVCRRPGFAGFMLQCELCRDWFHGKCVFLPNLKDSETERLRYMCPRCERSLRPDLNQVLSVLDDVIQALPVEQPEQQQQQSDPAGSRSDVSCGSTNRVMCLLRLPEFVAVQLLCERAFLFIRHLRETILSTPELHRAITEYEQFAGVKMPLATYTEDVETGPPLDAPSPSTCVDPDALHQFSQSASDGTRTQSWIHGVPESSGESRDRSRELGRVNEEPITSAARGTDELTLDDEAQYRTQDPTLMSLMMRKQTRKAPLVTRGSVSDRMEVGQEAEAAEALAGMSTSFQQRTSTTTNNNSNVDRHRPFRSQSSSHLGPTRPPGHHRVMPGSASATERRLFRPDRPGQKGMPNAGGRSNSVAYIPVRRDASGASPTSSSMDPDPKHRPLRPPASPHPTQVHHTLSNPVTKFRVNLSHDTRAVLESLIMEACLLEVNVPQTRWLWQLHLATDPEVEGGGAYRPAVARAEEEKLKRRFIRHMERIKCAAAATGGKRRRTRRDSSSSSPVSETEADAVDAGGDLRHDMPGAGSPLSQHSDTTTSSPHSARSESDRHLYSVSASRRQQTTGPRMSVELSSVGRPRGYSGRQRDGPVKRRPYRPRGTGSSLVSAALRRHDPGQPQRLPITKRRSLNRPVPSGTSSRFGMHYPSARYMNMKLYRQRLAAMNRSAGGSDSRMRYSRLGGTEISIRARRPRRGLAGERFARDDRVVYRTPDALYTSESEEGSPVPDQRIRPSGGQRRRRRIARGGGTVGSSSRPTRRPYGDRIDGWDSDRRRRRRRRGGLGLRDTRTEADMTADHSDSDSTMEPDRDEDDCAARPCENPRTGTVEWIACDGCGRWFHQLCVGIRHKSQVPEVYICPRCSKRSAQHSQADLSADRERIRARRMRDRSLGIPAAVATAAATTSGVSSGNTGSAAAACTVSGAPPMRMREFHYSDGARSRTQLSYMAVQRPIGWAGAGGSYRSASDMLYSNTRTRATVPHHLTSTVGLSSYDLMTERPLASAVADQWVADYPHSPGTDELDSALLNPVRTDAEANRGDEEVRCSAALQPTPAPPAAESRLGVASSKNLNPMIEEHDARPVASKDPTEVLLEAIEVLSSAVESGCSPETSG